MSMCAVPKIDSCGDVISRWCHSRRVKKGLVLAAIPAVVVYVMADVLSGSLYDGYSYADQAISELSAFGSPVRPLMVTAILAHGVLLLVFSIGLLRVTRRGSAVSWIGALGVAGFVIVGIPTHTFWAMSSRDMVTGFNDTMHIALSTIFSVCVMAQIVLSAVGYRGWFRFYALATLAVVVIFGLASGVAIQGIEQDDTPWAGGFERINAYAYFAWLVALALMVVRHELTRPSMGSGSTAQRPKVATGA
jgi:hypothetical membrane protein